MSADFSQETSAAMLEDAVISTLRRLEPDVMVACFVIAVEVIDSQGAAHNIVCASGSMKDQLGLAGVLEFSATHAVEGEDDGD